MYEIVQRKASGSIVGHETCYGSAIYIHCILQFYEKPSLRLLTLKTQVPLRSSIGKTMQREEHFIYHAESSFEIECQNIGNYDPIGAQGPLVRTHSTNAFNMTSMERCMQPMTMRSPIPALHPRLIQAPPNYSK